MYIDYTYIYLVLPAVIFSLWASFKVQSTFKKYSAMRSSRGITGFDAARRVLNANGIYNVQIDRIAGNLTDNFDPRTNTIHLSESVYGSTSWAAIGVAAHEAGHAVQHAVGYKPVKVRTAIISVTNIGSQLSFPLVLIGLIFSYPPIAYAGVLCFGLVTLFQLVTLPTEFNASKRALEAIRTGNVLYEEELHGAKKVLSAAAMTYVASLAVSIMNLLRLFIIVSGGNRRK